MGNIDTIKTLENADNAPEDPIALFESWMEEAEKGEPSDPNAMSLATVDENGTPSARIVLLKALDERGFVFYTNKQSRKGDALSANPIAALCFHWKSLQRQVRIEGIVEDVNEEESDHYFATRHKGSRIGAWASKQSRSLENRTQLKERVAHFEAQFSDTEDVQRPPHWGGYRIIPNHIEFWHEGAHRLHTRLIYKKDGGTWIKDMLYP